MPPKDSAEKAVRDIRRKTRRKFSAEEKIRIVFEGLPGEASKQNASPTIRLGGEISVVCIDWFRSGLRDEHVHTEVHVEDENGDVVIGAVVTWAAENDVVGVYQTNISATHDNDGQPDGQGCVDPSGSGVTDWFCCIGAGKFDGGEIPGKRDCDKGTYRAGILSVPAPPSTNRVWDGETPFNCRARRSP